MSTQAYWNILVTRPYNEVWKQMSNFTAPSKYWKNLESVSMEQNKSPMEVGAVRELKFKDGKKRYQTVCIDDRVLTMVELTGNGGSSHTGPRTTFNVSRILSPEKACVLEMRVDFGAGVTGKEVGEMEDKLKQYLKQLKEGLEKSEK